MRRESIALVLATVLALPGSAIAQVDPYPSTGTNGAPGYWIPDALGRDALGCLDAREPTERRIRLLETELELRTSQASALTATEAELRAALSVASAANARLELRVRRRSPARLLGIGAGLGGLLVGLLIGVIHR